MSPSAPRLGLVRLVKVSYWHEVNRSRGAFFSKRRPNKPKPDGLTARERARRKRDARNEA